MNSEIVAKTSSTIKSLFPQDILIQLAKESGLLLRKSAKFLPHIFFMVFIVHIPGNGLLSLLGICDLLEWYGCSRITVQALSLRLGNKSTVRFLKSCFYYLLERKTDNMLHCLQSNAILDLFSNIFIEDSTACNLHEKTMDSFKGSGGSASKAAPNSHNLECKKIGLFVFKNISR